MTPAQLLTVLESVTYTPPSSPDRTMADFYVLSYLGTVNQQALLKAGVDSAIRIDLEDVRHAESVLYPKLREQLLEDVFFALCCEIRHLFDNRQTRRAGPVLTAFYRHYMSMTGPMGEPDSPEPRSAHADDDPLYQEAHAAMRMALRTSGKGNAAAVAEMERAFHDFVWTHGYGGAAWAAIAAGWQRLRDARSLTDMAVAIDHVYDLQHNNGTVFTKLRRYYLHGGYGWIKRALDFKANLRNMRELLPSCSSQMRRMALPVLKAAGVPGMRAPDRMPGAVDDDAREFGLSGRWTLVLPEFLPQGTAAGSQTTLGNGTKWMVALVDGRRPYWQILGLDTGMQWVWHGSEESKRAAMEAVERDGPGWTLASGDVEPEEEQEAGVPAGLSFNIPRRRKPAPAGRVEWETATYPAPFQDRENATLEGVTMTGFVGTYSAAEHQAVVTDGKLQMDLGTYASREKARMAVETWLLAELGDQDVWI